MVIAASAVLVAPSAHAGQLARTPQPFAARTLAPPVAVPTSGGGRVIVGDFNGDGASDVLVYKPGAGGDLLEYGTGFGVVRGPSVSIAGTYTPAVGDFNGDGKTDVLWYDPAHPGWHSPMWLGATNGFTNTQLFNPPSPNAIDVYTPVVGDFNADGRDDIVWANIGPGHNGATHGSRAWYGNASGNFTAGTSPIPTVPCRTPVACTVLANDFNDDGLDNLLFYRSGGAADKLVLSTGSGFTNGMHISVSGLYEPFSGDFDGDGHGDVFWYAPGKPADHLWLGKVHGFYEPAPISIASSYIPVVGDFDGDAHSDIVWYSPGKGADYLRYGKATLFRDGPAINVSGNYVPVVGDFNGDGKDDIVWVAATGHDSPVWYGAASGFQNGPPVAL